MTSRRIVRVDQAFFDDLDRQLGSERGPNGEPSSTDFIVVDLPTVVDEFAENFDKLPIAYPGRSDYRVLVIRGILVAAAVAGRYNNDDSPATIRASPNRNCTARA